MALSAEALQQKLSKQVKNFLKKKVVPSAQSLTCPNDGAPLSYAKVNGGGMPATHIFQCMNAWCAFKVTQNEPKG